MCCFSVHLHTCVLPLLCWSMPCSLFNLTTPYTLAMHAGDNGPGWAAVFSTLGSIAQTVMAQLERGDASPATRSGLDRVREMALVAAAAAGDWRRALLLLREREATGGVVISDAQQQATAPPMGILAQYSYAIEACARAGRGREALALLQGRAMIPSSSTSPYTEGPRATKVLSNVLEALGSTGHFAAAFDLARPALSSAPSSSVPRRRAALMQQQQQQGMSSRDQHSHHQQHFLSKQAWDVIARGARARFLEGHATAGMEGLLWAVRAMVARGVVPGRAEMHAALEVSRGTRVYDAVMRESWKGGYMTV